MPPIEWGKGWPSQHSFMRGWVIVFFREWAPRLWAGLGEGPAVSVTTASLSFITTLYRTLGSKDGNGREKGNRPV